MFTWENNWKEIEDAKVRIAVVPVGFTEQHGRVRIKYVKERP